MNATLHAPWLRQLPSWFYKLGAQAWIDKEYPRHLFIETTAACNLACGYCPREKRSEHMEWICFTQIIDEASLYGPRSFSLHLFGEPLLYPRWQEAVAYIKEKCRKNVVLFTTNGTALNARVNDVIKSGIDQILWSWRPEAKFTPATKEKLRKWGKFRVRFIEEVTPKEAYAEWADWPNQESRKLHSYGGGIDVKAFGGGISLPKKRHPCYHLYLAPAVAWNGDILMCCALPHHEEVLGHFPEMSVHQAWTGEKLRSIRQSHEEGKYAGACRSCDVWAQYPNIFFGKEFRWEPSNLQG